MREGGIRGPIGIFDSGIGGLSLLRASVAELPHESFIYVADSAKAPYGDRPVEWILQRATQIVEFLVGQGCKAVVIACNTVTMVAVSALRRRFDVPIIAIEPAIKPAAALTKSGAIALMATSTTARSDTLRRLCTQFAQGVDVHVIPCPGLADRVEALDLASSGLRADLGRLLAPALEAGADVLVLGCTHYPFLMDSLRTVTPSSMTIIDPSSAVAAQVRRRISALRLPADESTGDAIVYWTSAAPEHLRRAVRELLGQDARDVRPLTF